MKLVTMWSMQQVHGLQIQASLSVQAVDTRLLSLWVIPYQPKITMNTQVLRVA